jgi:hypothetical protein
MIEALAREAERSELRQRLAAEAAESERETLGSGLERLFDIAKDRWLPAEDVVLVLAGRHQREAGSTDDQ